jgi:hypothetical protein
MPCLTQSISLAAVTPIELLREDARARDILFIRVNAIGGTLGRLHCGLVEATLCALTYLSSRSVRFDGFVGRTGWSFAGINTLCHSSPLVRRMWFRGVGVAAWSAGARSPPRAAAEAAAAKRLEHRTEFRPISLLGPRSCESSEAPRTVRLLWPSEPWQSLRSDGRRGPPRR